MSATTTKLMEEIEDLQGQIVVVKRRLTEGSLSIELTSLEERLKRCYQKLAEANDVLSGQKNNVLKG